MNSVVDDMRMLIDRKLFKDEASLDLSAYRSLLVLHPELRLELALHRYECEMVSLGRAAEIAGLSVEQLKEVMGARGVQRRIADRTSDEIKKESGLLVELA